MEEAFQFSDPAARLIEILSSASSAPKSKSFLHVWQQVFSVDKNDVVEVYHRLALLRDLTDDLERAIKQVPDIRHEQYLKVLPELRDIISRPNLGEAFDSHRSVLTMIVNALEFASERLQRSSPEPVLPAADLHSLREQAESILTNLANSVGLSKTLRLVLFDLITAIIRCLDEYRFRGIRGVREQLFVIASKIQEHLPEVDEAKANPEVVGFWQLFKRIDSMTAAALHVRELISIAAPLLPALVDRLVK